MKYFLAILITFTLNNQLSSQQLVEDVGHYTQIGLPITALGISIAKGDKQGSIQLLKSFTLETVVVQGMKRIVNRKRPGGGSHSFPSGHTAVSFMSSTYLWKRYGWEYGVPAAALATFVGYSRFGTEDPVHYFSDVVAGAAIGIGSSLLFTRRYEGKVKVNVIGDTSFVGIYMKINFD